ncbi:hypothetical protein QE152_g40056 [Popillia japonica]|uniref:Uncharacterized protein n=1 Tax=Popillia japonica TaxID=7064 RepID=A0AAW1HSK6_POPJA
MVLHCTEFLPVINTYEHPSDLFDLEDDKKECIVNMEKHLPFIDVEFCNMKMNALIDSVVSAEPVGHKVNENPEACLHKEIQCEKEENKDFVIGLFKDYIRLVDETSCVTDKKFEHKLIVDDSIQFNCKLYPIPYHYREKV